MPSGKRRGHGENLRSPCALWIAAVLEDPDINEVGVQNLSGWQQQHVSIIRGDVWCIRIPSSDVPVLGSVPSEEFGTIVENSRARLEQNATAWQQSCWAVGNVH